MRWHDQDMTQEQLEEMMQQAGKSNADGGKELQISLEQKEGGSAGEKQQQQCAPLLCWCPQGLIFRGWFFALLRGRLICQGLKRSW